MCRLLLVAVSASAANPCYSAARVPVEFGGGQLFHEIVAVMVAVFLRLVVPIAAQRLQRGAAGGFVAAVFIGHRQVVAGAHLFGDKHKAVAGVHILLLDLRGLGVIFGTVGSLKALCGVFGGRLGAGGGQAVVLIRKMCVEPAIFRTGFAGGFGHGNVYFVAGKGKAHFAAFAVAVNIVVQTAFQIAQIAAGIDGVDGKGFAVCGQVAAFKGLVFEHIFLRMGSGCGGSGHKQGEEDWILHGIFFRFD